MASLSDLAATYAGKGAPSGYELARIRAQETTAKAQAPVAQERIIRNQKYEMPNLLGAQAARGAYNSSGTQRKRQNMTDLSRDQTFDVQFGLANVMVGLGANSLLSTTGIKL